MKRILDERPDSPEAALLRGAARQRVPARSRKRALASVALAAAALSTTTVAVSASAGLVSATWLKWIAGALFVSVVGGGAYLVTRSPASAPIAPASASGARVVESTQSSAAPPTAPPAPVPVPAEPPVIAEAATAPSGQATVRTTVAPPSLRSTTAAAPPAPAVEASASRNELADEVVAIEEAKRALAAGRPGDSMARLDAYESAHRSGKLRQEADALRIRASLAMGRRGEAQTRLRAFNRAYPASPHSAALEAAVAAAPP